MNSGPPSPPLPVASTVDGATDGGSQPPEALTVAEAAELLRLDPRTVRNLFQRGELAGNQAGRAIRLSRTSVLAWLGGKTSVSHSRRSR